MVLRSERCRHRGTWWSARWTRSGRFGVVASFIGVGRRAFRAGPRFGNGGNQCGECQARSRAFRLARAVRDGDRANALHSVLGRRLRCLPSWRARSRVRALCRVFGTCVGRTRDRRLAPIGVAQSVDPLGRGDRRAGDGAATGRAFRRSRSLVRGSADAARHVWRRGGLVKPDSLRRAALYLARASRLAHWKLLTALTLLAGCRDSTIEVVGGPISLPRTDPSIDAAAA